MIDDTTSNQTIAISIVPSTEALMATIDRLICDGAYFDAVNVALSFNGPDVLAYVRDVAERCAHHREGHRTTEDSRQQ